MTTQTNTTLVDEAVERALHARVPGGAEVWCFLPQKDAWTPHETAYAVIRAALEAAGLASLPTDDDDTVERVARGICEDGAVPNSWASRSEHQRNCYRKDARAAIHTLIGRDK